MDQKNCFKILFLILGIYLISIQVVSAEISTSDGTNEEQDSVAVDRHSYKLPTYNGKLFGVIDDAAIFNVKLNQTHPYFVPKCCPKKLIKIVELNGTMHTLTRDICNTFERIKKFKVMSVQLKMIHANAFRGCKELKSVSLKENKLTTLPANLFEHNEKLLFLNLIDNTITNLDGKLFVPTPDLRALLLENNQLEEFPFDDMPVLNKLKEVAVDKNPFTDLDSEKLLEVFPTLRFISISKNSLGKNNTNKICKALKEKQENFECLVV